MSEQPKDGGPAFPTENERQIGRNEYHYAGMSLRDYFAARVAAHLAGELFRRCCDGTSSGQPPEETNQTIAQAAYALADAMLKERAKCQNSTTSPASART